MMSLQGNDYASLLLILTTIAPDTPFPIRLIVDLISFDSFITEDQAAMQKLFQIRRLSLIDDVIAQGNATCDRERETLLVSPNQQAILQRELRTNPVGTPSSYLTADSTELAVIIALYHEVNSARENISIDHIGLFGTHIFHCMAPFLEQRPGSWILFQGLSGLFTVAQRAGFADSLLHSITRHIMDIPSWEPCWINDPFPVRMILECARGLRDQDWPERRTWALHCCHLAGELLNDLTLVEERAELEQQLVSCRVLTTTLL